MKVQSRARSKLSGLSLLTGRLLSQPGPAPARAPQRRVPRRAGRLSPDPHQRLRRPRPSSRHLGRKRRHLHQLRAPHQQGQPHRHAPRRSPPDFDIFLDLAQRLGVRDKLFPGWTTTADAYQEWQRVSAGRLCDYSPTWEQSKTPAASVGRQAPLRRRHLPHRRRSRHPPQRPLRAFHRAAQRRVRLHPEHRPHRGALAHPHQDLASRDAQQDGPQRLARDESPRRQTPQAKLA